jgi:23S rRNA (uracil1939-C5)-methyltransferase
VSERVRLHGMAYGGAAVGRLEDGAAVFVQGGLAGELVDLELIERKKNFARGRLIEVLEPAPGRIEPPCPHFLEGCGGCQWQHATYAAQLAYKQAILADQLRRMGGIADPPLQEPLPSALSFGYRNTAEFHLADRRFGFHREGSHELVDVADCPLVEAPINAALGVLRRSRSKLAGISSVQVRNGTDTLGLAFISAEDPRAYKLLAGELAPELEAAAGKPIRVAGVRAGSDRMRGLYGEPRVHMSLGGRSFRVSALSFFQVNSGVAEALTEMVALQFKPGDRVLDLFSGVGTFALLAAEQADDVVGVEAHPSAMADAAANAAEAGAENARFIPGDVASAVDLAAESWDLAILDPPRAGCPSKVLDALNAQRVVYVSCDPSTLARDLKLLLSRGFTLASVQLLDMFPQTYHIEAISVLTR